MSVFRMALAKMRDRNAASFMANGNNTYWLALFREWFTHKLFEYEFLASFETKSFLNNFKP